MRNANSLYACMLYYFCDIFIPSTQKLYFWRCPNANQLLANVPSL